MNPLALLLPYSYLALLTGFPPGHEIAPSISLSDISIQVNSMIVFEALAHGYPTPVVTWFKV